MDRTPAGRAAPKSGSAQIEFALTPSSNYTALLSSFLEVRGLPYAYLSDLSHHIACRQKILSTGQPPGGVGTGPETGC